MFVLKWARPKIGIDCIRQSYRMCSLLMETEMEPRSINRFNRVEDWQILGLLLPKHDTTDTVRNTIQLNTTRQQFNTTRHSTTIQHMTRHDRARHGMERDIVRNTVQINTTRHDSNSTQHVKLRRDTTHHDMAWDNIKKHATTRQTVYIINTTQHNTKQQQFNPTRHDPTRNDTIRRQRNTTQQLSGDTPLCCVES